MKTTYIAELLFTGEEQLRNQAFTVEDGMLLNFDTCKNSKEIKLHGTVTAGFIDAQVNGGGGKLFNHTPTVATLRSMVKAHSKFGSTSLLPTLITSDLDTLEQAANSVAEAIDQNIPGIIGVHFEGPHLSSIKKGIHNEAHIRHITKQELDVYCRNDLGVKVVTLAPESVDVATIKVLVEHNVIVCLGHSNATFEQANQAINAGAMGFTHLFNAMSGLASREPNMVGAAIDNEGSYNGLILDGYHVHPACARIAYKAKSKDKTILVTDSMSTIGSDQKEFDFDGHKVLLKGDKLLSHTGQLAGSALNMITAVNNACSMLKVELAEALNMASLYPAQFLNISPNFGQLTSGGRADFLLLNADQQIEVKGTWIAGKQVC